MDEHFEGPHTLEAIRRRLLDDMWRLRANDDGLGEDRLAVPTEMLKAFLESAISIVEDSLALTRLDSGDGSLVGYSELDLSSLVFLEAVLDAPLQIAKTGAKITTLREREYPQSLMLLPVAFERALSKSMRHNRRDLGSELWPVHATRRIELDFTMTMSRLCLDMSKCYACHRSRIAYLQLWNTEILASNSRLGSWSAVVSEVDPKLGEEWRRCLGQFLRTFKIEPLD